MLRDSPWGRLEPGHYTRNLHGYVLSCWRERVSNAAEMPRVTRLVWRWVPTLDGRTLGQCTTLREAKAEADRAAQQELESAESLAASLTPTADAARSRLVHVPHPPVPAELAALGDAHTYSEAVCVECHPHPEHGGPCLARDPAARKPR